MKSKQTAFQAIIALSATLSLALAGCSGNTDVNKADSGGSASGGSIAKDYDLKGATITVGSKEFTENKILGQIAIAAIQAAGGKTNDKTGISGTDTVRAALQSKAIDLYWEYTGTGWVNNLKQPPTNLPSDLFSAVKEKDAANGVTWIGPAPFNDTYAIAVAKDFSDKNKITTLSEAATYANKNASEAKICAASEFLNRDDGLPGVNKSYGMNLQAVELDLNLVYTQIGKDCNFGEVTSTDARVKANKLVVLKDDKKFFVPYNGAVTIRTEVADKYPALGKMFKAIMKGLDDKAVTDLNAKVDLDGEKDADAAKEYLKDKGFIG